MTQIYKYGKYTFNNRNGNNSIDKGEVTKTVNGKEKIATKQEVLKFLKANHIDSKKLNADTFDNAERAVRNQATIKKMVAEKKAAPHQARNLEYRFSLLQQNPVIKQGSVDILSRSLFKHKGKFEPTRIQQKMEIAYDVPQENKDLIKDLRYSALSANTQLGKLTANLYKTETSLILDKLEANINKGQQLTKSEFKALKDVSVALSANDFPHLIKIKVRLNNIINDVRQDRYLAKRLSDYTARRVAANNQDHLKNKYIFNIPRKAQLELTATLKLAAQNPEKFPLTHAYAAKVAKDTPENNKTALENWVHEKLGFDGGVVYDVFRNEKSTQERNETFRVVSQAVSQALDTDKTKTSIAKTKKPRLSPEEAKKRLNYYVNFVHKKSDELGSDHDKINNAIRNIYYIRDVLKIPLTKVQQDKIGI